MNINDTTPTYPGSKHSNKQNTDLLFAAWCALTVLPKERSIFEGIVSELMHDGAKAMREKVRNGVDVVFPVICSTGGVLVITHYISREAAIQHEVCITCCHKYSDL